MPIQPGNHWPTIGAQVESRESLHHYLKEVLPTAETIYRAGTCEVLESVQSEVTATRVLIDQEKSYFSAFPCLRLSENRQSIHAIEIIEINEWVGGQEANLIVGYNGVSFACYDIDYARNKELYKVGGIYPFLMGGLCYRIEQSEELKLDLPTGPIKLGPRFSCLLPALGSSGENTISKTEAVVKGEVLVARILRSIEFHTYRVVAARPQLSGDGDCSDLELDLYALSKVVSDPSPKVGEGLFATAWIQGRLAT